MPTDRSRNTKEAILDEGMRLFSERGYKATTVRDIAKAVGIKDASLYNHYPSKQAIFDAIVERGIATMSVRFRNQEILVETSDDASVYGDIAYDDLLAKILDTFAYFFDDPCLVDLRRLLAVNQFEDEKIASSFRFIFFEQPIRLQMTVFSHLIETGEFKQADTYLLALQFYGPIFYLLFSDTAWTEAKPLIAAHFESFYHAHVTYKETA